MSKGHDVACRATVVPRTRCDKHHVNLAAGCVAARWKRPALADPRTSTSAHASRVRNGASRVEGADHADIGNSPPPSVSRFARRGSMRRVHVLFLTGMIGGLVVSPRTSSACYNEVVRQLTPVQEIAAAEKDVESGRLGE